MKKGLGKGLAALIGDLDEKSNDQGTKINTEVANDQTNVPIEFLVPLLYLFYYKNYFLVCLQWFA